MTAICLHQVHQHLHRWIENFLSIPHINFGGLPPCPFSRQAWIEHRVEVRLFENDELENEMVNIAATWSDRLDVCVLACQQYRIDAASLDRRVEQLNLTLAKFDLVALVDCPHNPATTLSHTNTSNQEYTLVLVQRLSHLQALSDRLRETDYYRNWSAEDFDRIVNWRSHLARAS